MCDSGLDPAKGFISLPAEGSNLIASSQIDNWELINHAVAAVGASSKL